MPQLSLNTRRFWHALALGLLALALAACGAAAPAAEEMPAEEAAPAAEAMSQEAPALAALVARGELPPLDERLPKNPMVVPVTDAIGQYGGTWRSGLLGQADAPWVRRTMAYEPMMRWTPDLTGTIPNVAADVDVNDAGTEFTFSLREGMRWSDGAPFTADDVMFWYEHYLLNDELQPVKPLWMRPGGTVGTVEKIDDYAVKFSFAAPHGLFLRQLGSQYPFEPAHHMSQFHIDFDADNVEALVSEMGLQDWVDLYGNKRHLLNAVDLPVVWAWTVTTPASSATQMVAERNPYYWKTDPAGNQLPYIDRLVYPIVENVEVQVLKALAGEVDMQDRHIATPGNKASFFDGKAEGDYDFFTVEYAWETPVSIGLNLAHPDEALRAVFLEKDFRIALSHAMNRQEIIDILYVGDGEPRQPAPLASSPWYNERLAYQYTEYDPDQANQLLDALGYAPGPDGIRLRPDGAKISFDVNVIDAFEPWAEIMELVSSYWKEVGVEANVQVLERSLFYERKAAYEYDVAVWTGADGIALVMDPRSYFPYSTESLFGVAWADHWRSGGSKGAEPPPAAVEQQRLYEELQVTVEPAEQDRIMNAILDIAAENFWVMGVTKYYQGYGIVKNNFKNVPDTVWQWHVSAAPAQTNPEQYYIEQ